MYWILTKLRRAPRRVGRTSPVPSCSRTQEEPWIKARRSQLSRRTSRRVNCEFDHTTPAEKRGDTAAKRRHEYAGGDTGISGTSRRQHLGRREQDPVPRLQGGAYRRDESASGS